MCYTERLIRAESCQKDIHLTAFLAELILVRQCTCEFFHSRSSLNNVSNGFLFVWIFSLLNICSPNRFMFQISIAHLSEFIESILKYTYYLIKLIFIFARKTNVNHVAKDPRKHCYNTEEAHALDHSQRYTKQKLIERVLFKQIKNFWGWCRFFSQDSSYHIIWDIV